MPRNRKHLYTRTNEGVLTEDQADFLKDGYCLDGSLGDDCWIIEDLSGWVPFKTRAEIETAWKRHRTGILKEWISMLPGTRPWCWWALDAPDKVEYFDGDQEAYLREHGLLSTEEEKEILLKEKQGNREVIKPVHGAVDDD